MAASVQETMDAINSVCRARGGSYASYSCKVVSWDDVSRGTVGGSLSCWGANITDTYLKSRNGEQLFTVRSDNWNEKLGTVSADEVALVASQNASEALRPVTLRTFLEQIGSYGSYAGLVTNSNLSDAKLDTECSIRFQTTFLPVAPEKSWLKTNLPSFLGGGPPAKLEFCTEAYNYNTMSDQDPRNLVLLCTSQGVAVQQDGRGTKKLLHHAVDAEKKIHRYWLEAEETRHQVGGQQKETEQERNDALARGKATASVIGTRAMGQRFNVLMTIQIPLKQKPRPVRTSTLLGGMDLGCMAADFQLEMLSLSSQTLCASACALDSAPRSRRRSAGRSSAALATGRSSAARVSRGPEYDLWDGLAVTSPERNESEHVTITVVIYNAVTGGVPSEEDVVRAIDDMEALYESTRKNGKLADAAFEFMKKPLEAQDVVDIATKLEFQPPTQEVENFDVFPTA